MMAADSHPGAARAAYVRGMFGAVARRYDLLNHLLSAGLDIGWRRRAAAACDPQDGQTVVDVCCGTGDLAMAVARRMPEARVIACDFARPMLDLARRKFAEAGFSDRAAVLEADALALPLPDASVDAITCAFGLRNLADPSRGLAEMLRVLRPWGAAVVLEFHPPGGRGVLAGAFRLYFRRILPNLGAWISGSRHGGYRYLVESVEAFSAPEATAAAMARTGFESVRIEPLTAGVVSLFVGRKPG